MEAKRQLVHLSGLLFVFLAQFTDGAVAAFYFFMIAATFLLYSEHVRREKKRIVGLLDMVEKRFHDFVVRFEREGASRPFLGAFWFYVGCGIAFLLFPLAIASAACAMLAVGDSLSTFFGKKCGRHRLIGSKTLEGSAAFFTGAFLASLLFVGPWLALAGSVGAVLAELAPEAGPLLAARKRGFADDNLLIPVMAGFVMMLFLA